MKFLVVLLLHCVSFGNSVNSPPVLDHVANRHYRFQVKENSPIGTHAGRIVATDPDGPQELTYTLTPSDKIELGSTEGSSKTGRHVDLVLKLPLDRELLAMFTLQMTVSDGQNSVPFQVDIIVIDEDDNAPTFTQSEYKFTVNSDAPVGHLAGFVYATDLDAGINGQIRFSLQSTTPSDLNYFFVNVFAGMIHTKAPLISMAHHVFHLTVVGSDPFGLTSKANVTITVVPVAPTLKPAFAIPTVPILKVMVGK